MIRRESFFPVLLAPLWGFNWPAVKIALRRFSLSPYLLLSAMLLVGDRPSFTDIVGFVVILAAPALAHRASFKNAVA